MRRTTKRRPARLLALLALAPLTACNVWCSSCMVASSDGDPIGIVTGAKRERETLVHRIGVRPGFAEADEDQS